MGVIATSKPARELRVLPLRTLSDERLAQLAGMGHTEAFETLYERYRVSLARYCRSIVRDPDDANDALQNTMLAVLNAVRVNSPNGPIRPWLYRIAHNEAISLIRRRHPHEELSIETPGRADTERGYESRDRLGTLLVDLRSLPERQRGALVMRELGGLQYDEIGSALRTSAVSARKAVFEARVALHDLADARDTDCGEIKRRISDGDGRALRARGIRGHLRGCASCSAFERGLRDRRGTFALMPVFPVISVGALLGIALPGGGGGSTSGLALGGSAAGGSLLGGGGVAAVKGIALGSAIAVAGAGVLVGTGINSHVTHHHRATVAAAHAPHIARARVGAPALAQAVKPAHVLVARTPKSAVPTAYRVANVTPYPTSRRGKPAVASQPNARGPSVAVPVANTTPTAAAPGPPATGPTATSTTPTSSPTATAPSPTNTTPATTATATPPTTAGWVDAIIQNALRAAGANLAAAEAQAGQALAQAGMAQGTAAATVQSILGSIFHGGQG
jgi:RNA polymerase sigma factor (sigma-70 family)